MAGQHRVASRSDAVCYPVRPGDVIDVRIMNATEFHHEEQEAHEGRPGMPVFFLSFFVFFVVLLYLRGSQ
jgi:hypothetical protein